MQFMFLGPPTSSQSGFSENLNVDGIGAQIEHIYVMMLILYFIERINKGKADNGT